MSIDKYNKLRAVHCIFNEQKWTFAKTMKSNPHWYCLGKKWTSREEFDFCLATIEAYGETEYFYNRPYQILRINGWKYWVMDSIFNEPKALINKAVATSQNEYCVDARRYDSYYSKTDYINENEALAARIHASYLKGKVLDIGCGTGLLLDLFRIHASNYQGVDPSANMCKEFKRKHPNHCIWNCKYEAFTLEGFDSIVALYGVFSYVQPDFLPTIWAKLNPGGRYFLMFYADKEKHLETDLVKSFCFDFTEFREFFPKSSYLVSQWQDYMILEGRKDILESLNA